MCVWGGGDFVVFLNVITNICVFDLFILVFVLTSIISISRGSFHKAILVLLSS